VSPPGVPLGIGTVAWRRLGFLSLDPNEQSGHQVHAHEAVRVPLHLQTSLPHLQLPKRNDTDSVHRSPHAASPWGHCTKYAVINWTTVWKPYTGTGAEERAAGCACRRGATAAACAPCQPVQHRQPGTFSVIPCHKLASPMLQKLRMRGSALTM
jgi:hypothetical protein